MITEKVLRDTISYLKEESVIDPETLDFMLTASLEKLRLQESIKEWEGISYGQENNIIINLIEECEELVLPNGAKGAIWKNDLIEKINNI